ncbi:CAP domain-containing protein [Mucilaginibacter myungsuensis]|uniref:CAP domain-containing protein n=1 Tax=Mucilaginibacter myungsuensis TaxID=649104 RepID=A0A929PX57_9SPHI|nr:CAP domain-containing protein [Mucilaginibacter myungsuensis]MBE9661897.1 CAP domain-containing protein [Mucilaginibacter myungsuensis]MDN3599669.1 CAP domain-containing protein [Mucilaginibacter myungsuensis]
MREMLRKGSLLILLLLTVATARPQDPEISGEEFKSEFLRYINGVRKVGCNCGKKYYPPAPPITWNPLLQKAAFGHARDMNDKRYFGHDSRDGRSIMTRIVQAGYYFKGFQDFTIGENIARGQQSIREVMTAWFQSEGHCKNLMNPKFKEVGVVQYNDYWVQDFGGRTPFSAEVQKMLESGKAKIVAGTAKTWHD